MDGERPLGSVATESNGRPGSLQQPVTVAQLSGCHWTLGKPENVKRVQASERPNDKRRPHVATRVARWRQGAPRSAQSERG